MDKKSLLSLFNEDDRSDVLKLYDKYILALEKDIPIFSSGFYPPNIWMFFEKTFKSNNFNIESYGMFDEAERRMISFNNIYQIPYPIKNIMIEVNSKFNKPTHRDFLGSVLGLGINRDKIGDLLLKDNKCYLPVCEEIYEFIIDNLSSIGRAPCKVTLLEDDVELPNVEFTEMVINVQSLRIDSVVAKVANISRAKAQDYIEGNRVLVDYNAVWDKSKEVEKGNRITIRGIGKFVLGDIIGNTKSGKNKVIIKKYT